jgi:hypothetical protein
MGCRRRRGRRAAGDLPAGTVSTGAGNPTAGISRPTCRAITGRLCDHWTAGVDVLPSVGQNSLCELTDNSALGVATSVAGPKTTKTALTILSPTISTPVFKHAASFRCWRHSGFAGSDSAFDPHDHWESNEPPSPSLSHSHEDL